MTAGDWTLVHIDENAIVCARREDGQVVVRFVQVAQNIAAWTFAIDAAAAPRFLEQLGEAWRPPFDRTVIGTAPASAGEGSA